ncbi:unnamed protein product [Leptidea sinapis]|uniref:Uncharacterized protein n=1 Tax=Leptidea sinapis TaxID=189913 RepID=A0A5E4Q9Y2_9NEOP|nr:unnamed protein product [Leptidea sinapis]
MLTNNLPSGRTAIINSKRSGTPDHYFPENREEEQAYRTRISVTSSNTQDQSWSAVYLCGPNFTAEGTVTRCLATGTLVKCACLRCRASRR